MTIAMMIDLETLSTAVDAVVVSGGWVIFNRNEADYIELSASEMKLSFQSQITSGRRIDEDTIRWHITNPTQIFIGQPLSYLSNMVDAIVTDYNAFNCTEVWSKGANFDIAILDDYKVKMGGTIPWWKYNQVRCFRTVQSLFPSCYEANPLAHNALEDARNQAKELWRITKKYNLT